MTGGDFSQEAYEALREAYANQLTSQEEIEMAGVQVMGQKLGSETLPVDSPWRDKIEKWEYPTGKSAYTDGPQKTPEEVLEIMRAAAAEREAAEAAIPQTPEEEIEAMSDEEFDSYVDDVIASLDEDEEEEDEEVEEEIEETEEPVEEEPEEVISEEPETEEEVVEDEEEVEEEVEEDYDPEAIANEIAAIREELEAMQFTPEGSDDDE